MKSLQSILSRNLRRLLTAAVYGTLLAFSLPNSTAGEAKVPARIELDDQHEKKHVIAFPSKTITVISLADRHGRGQSNEWAPVLAPYKNRAAIHGIADASGTPELMKNMIRKRIREAHKQDLLIDWSGATSTAIGRQPKVANLIIVSRDGTILHRTSGGPTPENVKSFTAAMNKALAAKK